MIVVDNVVGVVIAVVGAMSVVGVRVVIVGDVVSVGGVCMCVSLSSE